MYTADHLNSELHRLGVNFVAGDSQGELFDRLSPAELLAGLAAQTDARMRSAIIAMLLQLPGFGDQAHAALKMLAGPQRLTFQLYVTAAHILQLIYFDDLERVLGPFQMLPDLYSEEFQLQPKDRPPEDLLKQVASRHQDISGLPINWDGTYHHAARRVIARLEKEKEWAKV
jgi:hypothetical protein